MTDNYGERTQRLADAFASRAALAVALTLAYAIIRTKIKRWIGRV